MVWAEVNFDVKFLKPKKSVGVYKILLVPSHPIVRIVFNCILKIDWRVLNYANLAVYQGPNFHKTK